MCIESTIKMESGVAIKLVTLHCLRVMVGGDTHHGGQDEWRVDFTIKMAVSFTCMVRNVKC